MGSHGKLGKHQASKQVLWTFCPGWGWTHKYFRGAILAEVEKLLLSVGDFKLVQLLIMIVSDDSQLFDFVGID